MKLKARSTGPAEASVALRVAVLCAVMTGVLAVVREGVGGQLLGLACLIGIPLGALISYRRREIRSSLVSGILGMLVVIAAVVLMRTLSGLAGPALASDARVPLAEFFLILEVVRSFEQRSRRDLLFTMWSSLTLLALAGVLSRSVTFGVLAVMWCLAALAALTIAHRLWLGEQDPLEAAAPKESHLVGPILGLGGAVIGAAAILLVVLPTGPIGALRTLAASLPPSKSGNLSGGLSNPGLNPDGSPKTQNAYTGFNTKLDTGERFSLSNELVMRVRADRPDFWRGQTFDKWDGRSWEQTDTETFSLPDASPVRLPTPPDEPQPGPGRDLTQTFYVEQPGPNLIFASPTASLVYFPQTSIVELRDGTLRSTSDLGPGSSYTVVSHRANITATTLRQSPSPDTLPRDIWARYLQLPNTPQRVRDLAQKLTAGQTNTYDKVNALQDWMAAHSKYSLNIPPLPDGADSVDRFLFVDHVGFCEQIGSSLVVMLRSQGIPARLAVGYVPGERNPFSGLYEVKAKDAHAWAEVYFPGVGWQPFDPTANVPLAGDAATTSAGSGLATYVGRRLDGEVMYWILGGVALTSAFFTWRNRPRRTRRKRSWAAKAAAELESVGRSSGRVRQRGETLIEFARGFGDPRASAVAEAISREAFAPGGLGPEERHDAEEKLLALRRPALDA